MFKTVNEKRKFIVKYPKTLRKELFEYVNKVITVGHWTDNWDIDTFPNSDRMGWIEEFSFYVPEEELEILG